MPRPPTPTPAPERLTVSQIAARLGSRHAATAIRIIERLGLRPDGYNARGAAVYGQRKVRRIQAATSLGVPADLLTVGMIARRLERDASTIHRVLHHILRLKPDFKLPRRGSYWRAARLPAIQAALTPRPTDPAL